MGSLDSGVKTVTFNLEESFINVEKSSPAILPVTTEVSSSAVETDDGREFQAKRYPQWLAVISGTLSYIYS